VLLEYVRENLGFSKGRPVMACLVYKAMVHWSMIEVERLNTFDARHDDPGGGLQAGQPGCPLLLALRHRCTCSSS